MCARCCFGWPNNRTGSLFNVAELTRSVQESLIYLIIFTVDIFLGIVHHNQIKIVKYTRAFILTGNQLVLNMKRLFVTRHYVIKPTEDFNNAVTVSCLSSLLCHLASVINFSKRTKPLTWRFEIVLKPSSSISLSLFICQWNRFGSCQIELFLSLNEVFSVMVSQAEPTVKLLHNKHCCCHTWFKRGPTPVS